MNNKNNQYKTQKGFTLIELMIVVAILGILSAIALPSYQKHVQKSRRTDAKVELLRMAQLQESFFAQNLSYAESLTTLGFANDTMDSEKGYYTVSVNNPLPANCASGTANPCTSYELRAIPKSTDSQSGDTACTGFGIDNVSRKFAIGGSSTTWATTTTAEKAKIDECWGK